MISEKQLEILSFPYEDYDAIICSGAVRSGKTSWLILAYIDWAMSNYNNKLFGICGKTVDSAIKNIILPYLSLYYSKEKYILKWRKSDKLLIIKKGNITNTFEVFGGKDESSFQLIQGRTLAGVLLDEVALMPQSFVNQALSRCSVEGSKYWFSCNPDSPNHWFYTEWILKSKQRNAKYLHFTMEDNHSLSKKTLERYKNQYSGVFYQRYILGEWVLAEGLVYDFKEDKHIDDTEPLNGIYYLSIDYGIVNPFACLLWCISGNRAYCIDEYYYNHKEHNERKRTDEEHYKAIAEMAKNYNIELIVIDPSATSFKETINRHGKYDVTNAKNSESRLLNGSVGRAAGFDIYISNNVPNSSNEYKIIGSYNGSCTYANQIIKTEAYRPEKRFSDAVKGLNIYGGKVTRENAIAVGTVKFQGE